MSPNTKRDEVNVKSTVDRWTVKRLLELVEQKKVLVPQFQRGLVWSQKRKDDLFDSLLRGYPIGSILVARDPKYPDSYRLLDGLQRTSTLRVFLEPGLRWLTEANFDDLDANALVQLLELNTDPGFQSWVLNHVRSNAPRGFKDVDSGKVAFALIDEFNTEAVSIRHIFHQVTEILERVFNDLRERASVISDTELSVIIFESTDAREHAEVFTRLNTKGLSLSKIQVLAARWADDTLNTRPFMSTKSRHWRHILEAVRARYSELEHFGFESSDYDPTALETSMLAYDFVFGLGKALIRDFPLLWGTTNATEEDSFVYSLLSALLSDSRDATNKEILELGPHLQRISTLNQLPQLVESIYKACSVVLAAFQNVFGLRIAGQKPGESPHAELQMVAYVAAAWTLRYSFTGTAIGETNNAKVRLAEREFQDALPYHLLIDLMSGIWRSAGDRRVGDVVRQSSRLAVRPSKARWQSVYNAWSQERLERTREKAGRRKRPSGADALFLRMVYLNKLGNGGLSFSKLQEELEWDHIVPISRLSVLANESNGLPIHVFANFGLLEKAANRKKAGLDPRMFIETLPSTEDRRRLEEMLVFRSDWLGDGQITVGSYMQFVRHRAEALFNGVITSWAPDDSA